MTELFVGVLFQLPCNVHVLGAFQHLGVNNVGNDCLIFTSKILVKEFNKLFTGYFGFNADPCCGSTHCFSFHKSGAKRPEFVLGASPENVVNYLLAACSSRTFLVASFFSSLFSGCFPVSRMQRIYELIGLFFRGLFREPVMLLKFSNELLALAVNHVNVVIRELAPLFLDLAFYLFPFSFNLVPVHDVPPWKVLTSSVITFTACAEDIRVCHITACRRTPRGISGNTEYH